MLGTLKSLTEKETIPAKSDRCQNLKQRRQKSNFHGQINRIDPQNYSGLEGSPLKWFPPKLTQCQSDLCDWSPREIFLPLLCISRCWESITYTTHADYTFLDNLEPLLERWKGPISLAMHAPGTDYDTTVKTIRYLRECSTQPVSEYVTFHIYFPSKHMPKAIHREEASLLGGKVDCSQPPPWVNSTSYKAQKKLLYPVNVGRNVARESALTYYVLASDIELYPSPGVIPDFLEMVRRQDPPLRHNKPKVFPLSIFELEANMSLPADKTELVSKHC